ncbi:cupin domain-containing protein [Mucilaginibacter segetis]|uniref:Cupin domain-containing protein n=1 Tax=Mucilaginibacter segetis TaxID=2793071 RepID=A0A934UMY9_9SPHI|nr:cupin domain-containing protein [Mucilaginibacter segetis]MBK0380213.1 cupin domain-containing protein [Mucilaginibacter segetis]
MKLVEIEPDRRIKINTILSKACSGGKLTIIEYLVGIGAGCTAHVCPHEDKVLYVAEGKFLLLAGGYKYIAEKGSNILIPCNTWHNFKNIGTITGKLLVTLTPLNKTKMPNNLTPKVKIFGNNILKLKKTPQTFEVVLI